MNATFPISAKANWHEWKNLDADRLMRWRIGSLFGVFRSKTKNAAFLELARNMVAQNDIAAQDTGPKIEISE